MNIVIITDIILKTMIDFQGKLSYDKVPHSKIRAFNVYPLSDLGFSQYVAPDSIHTAKYLDKLSPQILDEVRKSSENVERRHNNIAQEENKSNEYNRQNKPDCNENRINGVQNENAVSKNKISRNPKQRQPSLQNNSLKISALTNIKNTKISNINTEWTSKQKSGEFTSYAVPRVDNYKSKTVIIPKVSHSQMDLNKKTTSFEFFNRKILATIGSSQKTSGQNPLLSERDYLNFCTEENEKYKAIIESPRGVRNKISADNLIFPQLSVSPNKANKQMGERYNPYNYDLGKTKNMTKRNVYGALFHH
jgi:hypothetical protein